MTLGEKLITAEDLLNLPQGNVRRELVKGELVTMSPSGSIHSIITARLAGVLEPFIDSHRLGLAFGAEAGFVLRRDPDTVRAPDFAFVCKDRVPKTIPDAFWPGAPDFAVEVLSPSDSASAINEKIDEWLAAGVRLLWIVDPRTKSVTVRVPNRQPTILRLADTLSGEEVLPGLLLPVAEIFR